jgi:hypothetical protein
MESPHRIECVGSLLVHSHDMQELSDRTTRAAHLAADSPKPNDDFVNDPESARLSGLCSYHLLT